MWSELIRPEARLMTLFQTGPRTRKSTSKKTRTTLGLLAVVAASAVLGTACTQKENKEFRASACGTEEAKWCGPRTFAGGVEVDLKTLNDGHDAYMIYCYACHGENGDGRGPSSKGLRPPPRDFTQGIFKFARLRSSDELPNDDDLVRIVHGGLHGTAMLAWDIPEVELRKILQYIKTFAPQKWEKKKKNGELVKTLDPFELPADPWAGKEVAAVARGRELYHFKAECLNCHPAYGTKEDLYKLSVEASKREPDTFKPIGGFRDDPYGSVAKDSTEYGVKLVVQETHVKAHAEGEHAEEGKEAKEEKPKEETVAIRIFPPDFTFSQVRSVRAGHEMEDLFRVLSYGVYPIMPAWKGALEDKDIWAIAHYVKSLLDLRDTPEAAKMHASFTGQAPFEIPKPVEEKPAEPAAADADAGAPAGDAGAPAGDAGAKKDEKKKDEPKK
jgi:cytochrome c